MEVTDKKEKSFESPASPCNRICTLDDADVCLGCARTLAEIVGWARMTAAEQRAVLARLPARRRERAEDAR